MGMQKMVCSKKKSKKAQSTVWPFILGALFLILIVMFGASKLMDTDEAYSKATDCVFNGGAVCDAGDTCEEYFGKYAHEEPAYKPNKGICCKPDNTELSKELFDKKLEEVEKCTVTSDSKVKEGKSVDVPSGSSGRGLDINYNNIYIQEFSENEVPLNGSIKIIGVNQVDGATNCILNVRKVDANGATRLDIPAIKEVRGQCNPSKGLLLEHILSEEDLGELYSGTRFKINFMAFSDNSYTSSKLVASTVAFLKSAIQNQNENQNEAVDFGIEIRVESVLRQNKAYCTIFCSNNTAGCGEVTLSRKLNGQCDFNRAYVAITETDDYSEIVFDDGLSGDICVGRFTEIVEIGHCDYARLVSPFGYTSFDWCEETCDDMSRDACNDFSIRADGCGYGGTCYFDAFLIFGSCKDCTDEEIQSCGDYDNRGACEENDCVENRCFWSHEGLNECESCGNNPTCGIYNRRSDCEANTCFENFINCAWVDGDCVNSDAEV